MAASVGAAASETRKVIAYNVGMRFGVYEKDRVSRQDVFSALRG
jgi:hypothetical protein